MPGHWPRQLFQASSTGQPVRGTPNDPHGHGKPSILPPLAPQDSQVNDDSGKTNIRKCRCNQMHKFSMASTKLGTAVNIEMCTATASRIRAGKMWISLKLQAVTAPAQFFRLYLLLRTDFASFCCDICVGFSMGISMSFVLCIMAA